jgi:hypothetical protein
MRLLAVPSRRRIKKRLAAKLGTNCGGIIATAAPIWLRPRRNLAVGIATDILVAKLRSVGFHTALLRGPRFPFGSLFK